MDELVWIKDTTRLFWQPDMPYMLESLVKGLYSTGIEKLVCENILRCSVEVSVTYHIQVRQMLFFGNSVNIDINVSDIL